MGTTEIGRKLEVVGAEIGLTSAGVVGSGTLGVSLIRAIFHLVGTWENRKHDRSIKEVCQRGCYRGQGGADHMQPT